MQHLVGSGTPVLYIGRMVLKGYSLNIIIYSNLVLDGGTTSRL